MLVITNYKKLIRNFYGFIIVKCSSYYGITSEWVINYNIYILYFYYV